jgi:phospholipase D1/2
MPASGLSERLVEPVPFSQRWKPWNSMRQGIADAGAGDRMRYTEVEKPVLQEGHTCWRKARADRVAVIVDAAEYFAAVKAAVLNARHTVIFIGWDFDTRIRLDPMDETSDVPDELGSFLSHMVETRPYLQIYVLRWDLAVLLMPFRGTTPLVVLDWMTSDRIRFRLDHQHPTGSSHHQKIVVVDDSLAFCGGIDMTTDRWDTPQHADDDPRRVRPGGKPYEPWHDLTTMVDGDAARALSQIARERWRRATGEAIPECPDCPPCWPDALNPDFTDVDIAIARTIPAYAGEPAVREIEALYLAAIAAARQVIYIETQYLACGIICEALSRRLAEVEGPEIVIVMPESSKGWLEPIAMDGLRTKRLKALRLADGYARLRVFATVTDRRLPIYVHAKVLVVDDTLLRVGSSNINNRGMRLDTECDIAIEAASGAEETRLTIARLRNGLIAEHLGVRREAVEAGLEREGSLISVIDALIRPDGRSLVKLDPPEPNWAESRLADSQALDPEDLEEWSKDIGKALKSLAVGAVTGGGISLAAALGLVGADDEREIDRSRRAAPSRNPLSRS